MLGLRMMLKSSSAEAHEDKPQSIHYGINRPATGFATSIDAMAAGVALAFVASTSRWSPAPSGMATTLMATLGVLIGSA